MEHQAFTDLILDYLRGELSPEAKTAFEQHILNNPEAKQEFELLSQTWTGLEKEVEPSEHMDHNFYAFLDTEVQKQPAPQPSLWERINIFLDEASIRITAKQFALSLAMLLMGIFIGSQFTQTDTVPSQILSSSQEETEAIRSELVMLLIDQPSASKRLQAVNEANKLNAATELIIQALLKTLNNDPNANVRLASLESLANYTDIPAVREGLATSIVHQQAPLVQIALAELMVELQEKGAIESMKKLLERPEIDQTVKQKIEESILQI